MSNAAPGELLFEEASHTYTLDGKRLPSVTQVLEPLSGYAGIPAHILQNAAERGTAVHKICELYNNGILGEFDPALAGYLEAWKNFLLMSKLEVIFSELRMFHPTLHYAGTMDIFGVCKRKKIVLDIKSSAELMPSTGPQTAAYEELVKVTLKETAQERWGVLLRADGTFKIVKCSDRTDWATFRSCLNIEKWRAKHYD